jgi:hypothetical protein
MEAGRVIDLKSIEASVYEVIGRLSLDARGKEGSEAAFFLCSYITLLFSRTVAHTLFLSISITLQDGRGQTAEQATRFEYKGGQSNLAYLYHSLYFDTTKFKIHILLYFNNGIRKANKHFRK